MSTDRCKLAGGFALRHGLQLAAAVAAAYGVSLALGLPEGYWAVMSVLIVSRPDAKATARLGWTRVQATVLGAAAGIAVVWVQPRIPGARAHLPLALALVALLAFASAWATWLRTAAIAALIVADGGVVAGHSALQVALLRTAEIGVGVATGLGAASLGSMFGRVPRTAHSRSDPLG